MNVDPHVLAASAEIADTESGTLAAGFGAGDTAVASHLTGWVGQSQSAMAAASESWKVLGSSLSGRIAAHAQALRCSAVAFSEMEARHAAALAAVCPR